MNRIPRQQPPQGLLPLPNLPQNPGQPANVVYVMTPSPAVVRPPLRVSQFDSPQRMPMGTPTSDDQQQQGARAARALFPGNAPVTPQFPNLG